MAAARTVARKPRPRISASNELDPAAPRTEPGLYPSSSAAIPTNGRVNGEGGVSVVTKQRRAYAWITRFNPIRKLKADTLSTQIDAFKAGYLREFALMMDAIEHRDDVLAAVVPKREAAVKRVATKWQVCVNEDARTQDAVQAEAHKEALFHFYNNLTCTHALDGDLRGGMATFAGLAAKCIGHFWSAFEVLWKPTPEGLTAQMNYVPLWFFEKRTGKLRFLPHDLAASGDELVPNGWLVFSGPGLMEASAVNYLIKDLCRTAWLIYSQNQGMPGVKGTTKAAYGSDQWNAMFTALQDVLAGGVLLMGEGDTAEALDVSATGQLPFKELIQEQNERMASTWRGGSLGTISQGQGPEQRGVSLQADEEHKLACDDCLRLTETLNTTIDPLVIEWTFGDGVKPLAYVKVAPPPGVDVDRDLKVFDAADARGVEVGKRQFREHFNLAEPAKDDKPVEKADPLAAFGGGGFGEADATEGEVLDEYARDSANEVDKAKVLAKLNTPRNAKALGALLRRGAFK